MPSCIQCNRSFINETALQSHYKHSNAHKTQCTICNNRNFGSREALAQHRTNSIKHLKREWDYVCEPCKEGFDSLEDLEEHDHEIHTYCTKHKRSFINDNNLRQHLHSIEHIGLDEECPSCTSTFPTITATVKHMESGACDGGMTRRKVDLRVRACDLDKRFITNEWSCEPDIWEDYGGWNGNSYECEICGREYSALRGLNYHITQEHAPKRERWMYKCEDEDCGREFKMFGDLVGHVQFGRVCGARYSPYDIIDWT